MDHVFQGGAELVDASLFQNPAPPDEVFRFYGGAPLNWNIVAADALVRRDVLAQLIDKLTAPPMRAHMFCILGEPGAGKSSLARLAVRELLTKTEFPILRILSSAQDSPVTNVWLALKKFHQQVSSPFYVFVDDVFRHAPGTSALRELDTNLPATILATSRTSQFRPHVSFPVEKFELFGPSSTEIKAIFEKCGRSWDDLPWARRDALKRAASFLVLMYELTHGQGQESLDEIIRAMVDHLEFAHRDIYEAYKYICFTGQFDISMPSSLVGRLVPRWDHENLFEHHAARGIVFQDDEHPTRARAQHQVLAERAVRIRGWRVGPIFATLARTINPQDAEERRHFLHLALAVSRHPEGPGRQLLDGIIAVKQELQREAPVGEMTLWHDVLEATGLSQEADQAAEIAFQRQPESDHDWRGLILLTQKRLPPPGTFARIQSWLHENPDEWLYRSIYLQSVEKWSPPELAHVIDEVHSWLAEHSDDFAVREHFLGLVKRKGSRKQQMAAIAQTEGWLMILVRDSSLENLKATPGSQIWRAHLALIGKRGTDTQAAAALHAVQRWLAAHTDEKNVRQAYLRLASDRGTPTQLREVLDEIEKWLATHAEDRTVRQTFLSVLETEGSAECAFRVIDQTHAWLEIHSHDNNVRRQYNQLVAKRGTSEQIKRARSRALI